MHTRGISDLVTRFLPDKVYNNNMACFVELLLVERIHSSFIHGDVLRMSPSLSRVVAMGNSEHPPPPPGL